jgi:hypothetical protein
MLYNLQKWEDSFKLEIKRIQLENNKKDEDNNKSKSPMVQRRDILTEEKDNLNIKLAKNNQLENNISLPKKFDLSNMLSSNFDEEYNILKKQLEASETMIKIKLELEKIDIILKENISINIPQILPYYSTLRAFILNNSTDISFASLKPESNDIEINNNEENLEATSKKNIKIKENQSLNTTSNMNDPINISKNKEKEKTLISSSDISPLHQIEVDNENTKPINIINNNNNNAITNNNSNTINNGDDINTVTNVDDINNYSIIEYISSSISWLFGYSSKSTESTALKIDNNKQGSPDEGSLSINQLEERLVNLEKLIDKLQQNETRMNHNEKENLIANKSKPTSK